MAVKMNRHKIDMVHGSIWDKLPMFALPVAATAILEQLFNASDIAVVGNFTGADSTVAVAAVGANSPLISLILNLFIGIALGANVVIANAVGRKDRETVHRTVHTAILMALAGGVIVAVIGEIVIGEALQLLNVPADVYPLALLYIRIYLIGMPAILLYNFEAAIFRSIGETRVPLLALSLAGVLNVILNLFFVIVLHMTVNGVAIATVLSNIVSSLILLCKLMRTDRDAHVNLQDIRFYRDSFIKIMRIGMPAGIQSAVFAVANIVIQSAINSLGTVVIAASSAAYNIEIFAYDILNSFSQACTTFVGQNYGARKIGRCKKILKLCLIEDAIASALSILLILLAGRSLLAVFNNNPEVIDTGYTRLVIIFIAYIFSMLYEVMSGYLRGFGISLTLAIITTVCVCGVRILWIHLVFPLHRNFQTIMTAFPISLALTAICIFIAMMIYRPSRKLAVRSTTGE